MENNISISLLAQFDDACMREFDLNGCDNGNLGIRFEKNFVN